MKLKDWSFTLFLGLAYLALFHLWLGRSHSTVMLSGAVAGVVLAAALAVASRRGYFLNRWDRRFHAAVILDLWLESWLIPVHEGRGFYACALGFGLVLVGYRWYLRRSPSRVRRCAA